MTEPITNPAVVDTTQTGSQLPESTNAVIPEPTPVPGLASTPTTTPEAPTANQLDLRSRLSNGLGINLSSYSSDDAALQAISQVLQQAAQWRQQAQQYQSQMQQVTPHWSQFQQWLQTQQQAQQTQQTKPSWWNPPEYNNQWQQMIEIDANGNPRVKDGYSPDTIHKMNAYQNWQRETIQKLLHDPIGTLGTGIKELVQPMIQQAIQGNLGAIQERQQASSVIQNNAHWIYECDSNGTPVRNPVTGKFQYTQAGQMYSEMVQALGKQGITDPNVLHNIAYQSTLGQLTLMSRNAQAQQVHQPQPAPPPPGTQRVQQLSGVNVAPPTAMSGGSSLEAMLRNAFNANGITDDDIRRSVTG